MIVSFDKFNRLEQPDLILCNPACSLSDGVLTSPIGLLANASDLEVVDNFNEISELNFSIHRELVPAGIYSAIANRRSVYVEGMGFFVISSVEESESETGIYKSVSCQSCEIELQNRMMPYIPNGIYSFNDIATMISETVPTWHFDAISIPADRMRVFEDVDTETDVLSYMIDELQRIYGVLFEFDTETRSIKVYLQEDFVQPSGVQISAHDVLDSIEIKESSDDIYTVLNVEGGNELYIVSVNPLGENRIYNFAHYKSWMSPALRTKIEAWEAELADAEYSDDDEFKLNIEGTIVYIDDQPYVRYVAQGVERTVPLSDVKYLKLNQMYYKLLDESDNLKRDRDICVSLIELYNRCKENISSEATLGASGSVSNVVDNYNTILTEYNVDTLPANDPVTDLVNTINDRIENERDKIIDIDNKLDGTHGVNEQKEALTEQYTRISSRLKLENYLVSGSDTTLLREAESYMYQATYTDEYTTKTDSMTMTQQFEQSLILYNGAKDELSVICHPTQEFTVDAKYFIAMADYKDATEKIRVGRSLISVELYSGEVADLFLTSISVDYSSGTLSFTFGDRYNKYDNRTLYGDVFGNIQKTATAVSNLKNVIYPVSKGQLTTLNESIKNARNVSKTSAITSTNQEVNIDETGYTGRRNNGQGGFDPKQVKIVNNSIVFTDDGWKTAKTAVGEMTLGGQTVYGVNAEAIVGQLIIGENLALNVGEEDLRVMLEALRNNIASAAEYKNWMKFYPDRGLVIGEKNKPDVDEGEYTFYTEQRADGYYFYRSNNTDTAFMYISAIDGSINVDIAQISDKLAIGSQEYGGYFDFITNDNGLAIKWRDAETTGS